ncbi:hypothetical protein TUM22923_10670 [Polynucleobacter sp. TUM22923]|nr:hypothetical protein TUM22923_10670 [Polynucleobacter sp. TUM22923]
MAKLFGLAGTDGGKSTPLGDGNGAIGGRSAKLEPLIMARDNPAAITNELRALEND